uniref:G-protein coupled receptors family 1 profile domain-containing protein n=1 Tax=Anopheles dirus TaxID=7168 RepID=A0A182N401_9DIPT
MTESPFVYGVELRDPPTVPSDTSQYDLLFGPGSILLRHQHQHQPRQFSMADYDDPYYYASSNISYAFSDILRANVSTAIVREFNLTGPIGSSSTAVTLSGPGQSTGAGSGSGNDGSFQNQLIIPLYAIIFLLSVVGNLLVILTLAQNKRMRTVTNVYLLNLAISDLLLGVFCMPFTLVGQVLRRFVFGRVMCKLIPYFQ